MAEQTTTEEDPTAREPDVRLSFNRSRFGNTDKPDLEHFAGRAFDLSSREQDWEKAVREGDYVRLSYKSDRSGNTLTREGEVTSGAEPTNRSTGSSYVRFKDQDGQKISVRSDGRVTSNQFLGPATGATIWHSEERRKADDPFNIPLAEPGETVRFEYEGDTRMEEVRNVRKHRDPESGSTTGHYRYRLWYDYDREKAGRDEPEYVTTHPDAGHSHYAPDLEVVETVHPEDMAVTVETWEIQDHHESRVTLAGKDAMGEKVAEKTFRLDEANVSMGDDTLTGEPDGAFTLVPDPVELSESETTDLPVEGVDAHSDPDVTRKTVFGDLRSGMERQLKQAVTETEDVREYADARSRYVVAGDNLERLADALDARAEELQDSDDGQKVYEAKAAEKAASAVRNKL